MGSDDRAIREKVDRLDEQMEILTRRVAELEGRLGAVPDGSPDGVAVRERAVAPPRGLPPRPGSRPGGTGADESHNLSESVIRWASRASLFPRLATVCFLLVVALILRTITDNGIVNPLLGMALGMGYAAALMAGSWQLYRRDSSLAPVFAACGAILMSSIVVETHARFRSLPLVPAYWTLMATGAGMAFVSRQFKVFLPVSVGTLGMCLAGAAIDYPDPFFPYLFMILVTANLLGYYAGTLHRCGWLRWTVLLVTLAMFLLWGMRLEAVAARRIAAAATLAPGWFLPVLAVVGVTFPAIALLGIVRSGREKVSAFDFCLPAINAVGSYLAARVVVNAADGSALALNVVAILFALLHFGAAFWLAMRKIEGVPGTNSFVVAGSALLAFALPAALGGVPAAPVLAAAGLGVAVLSDRWGSGAIRATSYLLQVYAVVSLAVHSLAHGFAATPVAGTVPTAALAAAALAHYRWCRRHAPPARSPLFGVYDTEDLSGAVPFLAALAGTFLLLREIAWRMIAGGPGGPDAFQCAQSVIINLAALGLGLYAFRARNREIRNVAILVIAVGAVKSTADLLGTKGVPLVLSVFSFGLAAATQSIILSRWHKSSPVQGAERKNDAAETVTALSE
ncbi:MAG: hypothetical protein ACM3NF_04520 [Gemmatimonadota bacterium]